MCLHVRYTVILNGKETIQEAFVKHSLEFSDRPEIYTNATVFNVHAKGKLLSSVLLVLLVEGLNTFLAVSRYI